MQRSRGGGGAGMGIRFHKSGGEEYVPLNTTLPKHASVNTQKLQQTYLTEARKKVQKTKDYFEDDDSDDDVHPPPAVVLAARYTGAADAPNQDADIDPLDAYMNLVQQKVETQKSTEGQEERPEIVSGLEGELDEYIPPPRAEGDDSLDPEYEYDSDGLPVGRVPPDKKKIEPLAPVDHSLIDYADFRKNFYREHSDITALTEAEVGAYRAELQIAVNGTNVPRPIRSFMEAGFSQKLLREIVKHGFEAPTAIQAQALPAGLAGRDVIGIAKTGSGKTLGFVWPIIVHALDQPRLQKREGPIALILAPTRELAGQIFTEARKFARPFDMNVCAIFGGAGKYEMKKALAECPEIVVATPGRLIEMIKSKATNLMRCTICVLDEADRMFELGFEYQMRSLLNNVRPDRQVLMFSATFKKKVEALAQDILKDPVRITVGAIGQANEDILQIVHVLENDGAKWNWLFSRLQQFVDCGKLLVFVSSKSGAEELADNLAKQARAKIESIHGDRDQSERSSILRRFKHGETQVLIATDVAARGLDIKDIKTVVNYDVAKNIETHIHRIGRTGRMGIDGVHPGTAYTLVTSTESNAAVDLVKNLRLSKQAVPIELERLAETNPRFHAAMNPNSNARRDPKATTGLGFGGVSRAPLTSSEAAAMSARKGDKYNFDHMPGLKRVLTGRGDTGADKRTKIQNQRDGGQGGENVLGFVKGSTEGSGSLHSVTASESVSTLTETPVSIAAPEVASARKRRSRWDS